MIADGTTAVQRLVIGEVHTNATSFKIRLPPTMKAKRQTPRLRFQASAWIWLVHGYWRRR